MIALKTLLAGSFLLAVSLGFFTAAKKISCHHLFQRKAFSMLTRQLHSKNVSRPGDIVCGEVLLTKKTDTFVRVQSLSQRQVLKLNIEGHIVNEY